MSVYRSIGLNGILFVHSPKSTGNTQEALAPSRHDWKIVDWDVKYQNKLFVLIKPSFIFDKGTQPKLGQCCLQRNEIYFINTRCIPSYMNLKQNKMKKRQ